MPLGVVPVRVGLRSRCRCNLRRRYNYALVAIKAVVSYRVVRRVRPQRLAEIILSEGDTSAEP